MKILANIACAAALAAGPLQPQARAAAQDLIPETTVGAAATPVIHSDRSITFELKAPNASSVKLAGGDGLGAGPFNLTRRTAGLWSITIPPPVPGFHYYWFVVDGLEVNDPASRTYFGYYKETSGIEVPEAGADYYASKEVPHGEVRDKLYFSRTTNQWRQARVYAPPGYDADCKARFPVLYLQHGSGEDESGWTQQGRAQFILDNLIAAGKAKPMIVVMDRGYAAHSGEPFPQLGPDMTLQGMHRAFSTFEEVLTHDLIPSIDSSYRTLPDREHRAMAGLSMGGMQTMFIALRHLELFAYIASLSGPVLPALEGETKIGDPHAQTAFDTKTAYDGAFANPAAFNQRVKLLWLGVGTAEPERFRESIGGAAHALQAEGVKLRYFESNGTAHEWQTWRRDMNDLVPLLFR
jgi:enterochelin esterase-like enzyme